LVTESFQADSSNAVLIAAKQYYTSATGVDLREPFDLGEIATPLREVSVNECCTPLLS
jgi:hypothetical protein